MSDPQPTSAPKVTEAPTNPMLGAFAKAFEEWDRRYREDPAEFWTAVDHLLGSTPQGYGEAAAAYFVFLLDELAQGRPWLGIASEGQK